MKEIIITAFISALFSAYITTKIQRYFDERKKQKELYFDIYMKLMELSGWQFWLASAQISKTEESKDIAQKAFRLK